MDNRPFSSNWWNGNNYQGGRFNYAHYHNYDSGHWWKWATAGALTGWVAGAAWSQPNYYSYGSGGNVYYDNDVVYVDGQQYASADEYYEEAASIADSLPQVSDAQAEQIEWMSLGVFALTKEGVNDANMLLQLSVSQEGYIAGTFYNTATDTTRSIEGAIDEQSQRVAMGFADGQNPDVILECGVFNLTEDESEALVHHGADQVQYVVLVRLDDPQE